MAGTGFEVFTVFDFADGFFFPAEGDFLVIVDLRAAGCLSILAPFAADPSFSAIFLFFATGFPR